MKCRPTCPGESLALVRGHWTALHFPVDLCWVRDVERVAERIASRPEEFHSLDSSRWMALLSELCPADFGAYTPWRFSVLSGEEVEDVAELGGVALVDFSVAALVAGHGGELLVLDIEELGEVATSGAKLVGGKPGVVAFNAVESGPDGRHIYPPAPASLKLGI